MTVSIIIPVRSITPELRRAIPRLGTLEPAADEIIIIPDRASTEQLPDRVKIYPKSGGPATKRDFAARFAQGDILAFLDDDAYPRSDWLAKALPHFANASIAAVGGPAITPPGEGIWAAVSGAVFTSFIGSGPTRRRYWPVGGVRDIDDWPSVNLLVRKNVFKNIGGFDTTFWPGEDTKLCLDIVTDGYRIIYDPAVIVYHHRATTCRKHISQVARYGLHRGHFVRRFPATSRRPTYFLPSLALTAVIGAVALGITTPDIRPILTLVLAALALLVLVFGVIEAWRIRRWPVALLYPWLLIITHFTYSIMFIRGLLSSTLAQYSRLSR